MTRSPHCRSGRGGSRHIRCSRSISRVAGIPGPLFDDLVQRADLDGLVRMVDSLCASRDWPALLELRNRSKAAVATGRQLWPVATLAEYRLALWAPAEWAALVLDEESGRFTIGPLTEVVAQHHQFDELRPALPEGPGSGSSLTSARFAGNRSPMMCQIRWRFRLRCSCGSRHTRSPTTATKESMRP